MKEAKPYRKEPVHEDTANLALKRYQASQITGKAGPRTMAEVYAELGTRDAFATFDPTNVWKLGYLHQLSKPPFTLYRYCRSRCRMSRADFAQYLGMPSIDYYVREKNRYTFWPSELVALKRASNMTWDEFGGLLERMG